VLIVAVSVAVSLQRETSKNRSKILLLTMRPVLRRRADILALHKQQQKDDVVAADDEKSNMKQ